jgi:CHAT domain-containing protein/tetratricopeptide (TPR) repeat protein
LKRAAAGQPSLWLCSFLLARLIFTAGPPSLAGAPQATPQDMDRAAAQKDFDDGRRLLAEGTASSLRAALEKFEASLRRQRLAGDQASAAVTLNNIGLVYDGLGEKQRALDCYNQALAIMRVVGDRRGEAVTLNNIGAVYDALGEKQKVIEYFAQALPLLRAAGDRRTEAVTLNNLGTVYDALGEKQRALDCYNQALAIMRAVGDRRGEAATLNNIGLAYDRLGEKQRALDFYNQALPILHETNNRTSEAVTLNNIGAVYDALGERERALDYYTRALALRRAVGDRPGEAVTLNNIGLVYDGLGDVRKAIEYYTRSLQLRRMVSDRPGEAVTLNNLGAAYNSLGERERALTHLTEALQLRRATGDRPGEAITLNEIGVVYHALGEPERALDHYSQALALSRAVSDRATEALTLRGIARVERDRGRLEEARAHIEAALAIIESLRVGVISRDLRASYFASAQQYFDTYIDLLMQMHAQRPAEGYVAAAFQASERARARSLIEALAEARAPIRQGVEPALLEKERALRQRLNARAERQLRLQSAGGAADQMGPLAREIEELVAQLQETETQIRARSPRYAALTRPATLSLAEIQKELLEPDMLLLEYALGAEKSYLWAVTPTSIKSFVLPPRAEIEAAARRVLTLIGERNRQVRFETADERASRIAQADAAYPEAAGALSAMLLGPVAADLGEKRLLIVSDGALHYLPFAALPSPGEDAAMRPPGNMAKEAASSERRAHYVPLVADHEIVNLPSASTLGVLRRELAGRQPAPRTLAVLADPVFDKDDERVREATRGHTQGQTLRARRLPFTRREAAGIASLVPEAERLVALDFEASRARAVDPKLGQYRFVHFATHGFLDSEHPELSGIVLSLVDQRGAEQDGFLRAHDVFNLNLPAEMVTLSGCRTGLGTEVKGEGIIGLTRGFMYAGAARVLVSLWDVSDEASAELMMRLYRGILGKERLRPAAALRAAQLAIWREPRWRAPYYWAAFVLQGEPGAASGGPQATNGSAH